MATIAPFRAVRPKPELSAQVAAPPYDVVSLKEARDLAEGNPHCFLRIGRAELELDDGVDPYCAEVYQKGADNLRKLINDGVLFQEAQPLFGVYRQKWGLHEQTGLVTLTSVDEYNRGIIKKHEHTPRSTFPIRTPLFPITSEIRRRWRNWCGSRRSTCSSSPTISSASPRHRTVTQRCSIT